MKIIIIIMCLIVCPCLTKAQTMTIEENAFEGCMALSSIDIPFLCSLQNESFSGCTSLENFQAKDINHCGTSVFLNCKNLQTIGYGISYHQSEGTNYYTSGTKLIAACMNTDIPDYVTEIAEYVYAGQNKIIFITLPKSINKIGNYAFKDCTGLRHFTVSWDIPLNIEDIVFDQVDLSKCVLHCPSGMEDYYSIASVWKEFGSYSNEEASIPITTNDAAFETYQVRSVDIGLRPGLYKIKGGNIVVK